MDKKDNLVGVLASLYRWRKQLMWLSALTVISTAAVCFIFLKNHYQSKTIFYVAGSDLFKPEQVFNNSQKDIDYYGSEHDIDRVLTIAKSAELQDFLIQKFDLYKHYGLDSTREKGKAKVRLYLNDYYKVNKTKYDAIEMSVEDTDKRLAAEMANAARDKVDEIARRIIHESQIKLMKAYEASFIEKEKNLRQLGDSLIRLHQLYGVFDPVYQTEAISKIQTEAEGSYARSKARYESLKQSPHIRPDTLALAEATMKGYEKEMQRSNEIAGKYNQGYNQVAALRQVYDYERNQLGRDRQRYAQLQIAYNAPVSAIHIIEKAQPAYEKTRPKRSIIILSALLIALIFGSLFALLLDNYKDIDWRAVTASQNNGSIKAKKSAKQEV